MKAINGENKEANEAIEALSNINENITEINAGPSRRNIPNKKR